MGAFAEISEYPKASPEERCHEVTEWWHGGTIWGDHRLPARNTPQSTLLTVPLNGSLVKVSEYQKKKLLRRGVTIVTEWWQSEIRRGNHRLPEQVWWHTKNTKGDTKFMNILFVCTGNTCRSAMAAAIMDKIAVENDLDVFIESAGIFAEDGQGASENAIKSTYEIRHRLIRPQNTACNGGPYKAMRFNPNNDRGTQAKYLSLWQKARYTHYLNMQVQAVTYPILTAVTLKNMKKLHKRFMTRL